MTPSNLDPVLKEYSAAARNYDDRWSYYVDSTTRATIARLELRPTDRVLDVGCGTGELLTRIAAKYPAAQLSGLDPAPEMLHVARKKLSSNVEFRVGWANSLPWPDDFFNIVVSCNVFHYITHPIDAIREMGRVLRPGGQLVITDWCDDYLACRVCGFYLRFARRAHFKTYRQSECLALLAAAGHFDATVARYKISWQWGLLTARAVKPK